MSLVMIQGYLKKRAIKSGKNWKRRYFMLTTDGELQYAEKKGAPAKGSIQITKLTSISVLRELSEEGGICITGPEHEPLYLQAESQEVAEGWIQALEVIKAGGSNKLKAGGHKQGEDLRAAFAKKDVLGTSGRGMRKNTLDRRKRGTRKNAQSTLVDDSDGESDHVLSEVSIPEMEDDFDGVDTEEEHDAEDIEDEDIPEHDLGDGFIMRVGKKDYFVDSGRWNYYRNRADFLDGKKPIGHAVLANLV